jgi:hypothetical protein
VSHGAARRRRWRLSLLGQIASPRTLGALPAPICFLGPALKFSTCTRPVRLICSSSLLPRSLPPSYTTRHHGNPDGKRHRVTVKNYSSTSACRSTIARACNALRLRAKPKPPTRSNCSLRPIPRLETSTSPGSQPRARRRGRNPILARLRVAPELRRARAFAPPPPRAHPRTAARLPLCPFP